MKYISILAVALAFLACGEAKQTSVDSQADPIEALKKQAIEIHDEVMPKMGTLKDLQKQLNENKAALLASGLSEEQISGMVVQLMKADKDMMDWMRNYNTQVTRAQEAASPEIMEAQIKAISEVRDLTNSAIAQAEEALQSLEK